MIKIAICDDHPIVSSRLEKMLIELSEVLREDFSIQIFYTGETLCANLQENNAYDIIFLDIELNMMTGVEVGHTIRKEMLNESVHIIYISSMESYAMELFKLRPLDFLIKPLTKEKILEVLQTALKLIERNNKVFECTSNHNTVRVLVKDIMYFESLGRKTRAVCSHGSYEFYQKLSDIDKQFANQQFIRIHKSYLVNNDYIQEYCYEKVTMTDERVLPISQKNRKNVRKFQKQLHMMKG